MSNPPRLRRRPAVSCTLCRRRKIRCNRETPCSNCARSKNSVCAYDNVTVPPRQPSPSHGRITEPNLAAVAQDHHSLSPAGQASSISRGSTVPSQPSASLVANSTVVSTPTSHSSAREIESMRTKIRQLEEQLSQATQISNPSPASVPNTDTNTMSSNLAGTFHWHYEMGDSGRPEPVHRNVRHKTRLFGQSHWVNGLTELRDVLEIMEPLLRDGTRKASYNLQRCKSLAKIIKARRAPTWPTPPTSDIPPKEVADTLIECYLRTFETIYRVLHVPSFRRDYEALWVSETEPNTAFLVQLKLILALGTIAHDEQFSLRTSAVRWVYEAQTWLSEPEFKSRLNIQFLQTNILLLLARENIGVNGGSAWISAGVILRIAVLMGLHQDPACLPQGTTFALEMRRRMWNVVLEITLQSSMEGGAPPLLSLDDFDTEPPGNFDDDQLMAQDPIPKSEHEFTGMSMVIALRKMFPLRLAILKYLNGLSSHSTYDQTLRFDAQIRASYKTLCQILQQYKSTSGASPSRFEICTLDSLMCRYLSALHVPYLGAAIHEIAYAYSRKVVVETALKAWYVMYPPSPSVVMAASRPDPGSFSRDDFARFVTCGSGQHRHIAVQACYHIVIELKTQLQQEDSLGPVPLRPDLLAVLHDAKAWFIQSIRAGETSIKCYMFMDIVFALLDGLSRGVAKDELPEMLVTAAEEAEDVCLPILEQMAGQSQFEESFDELDNISGTELPDFMDGWDFMMPDASFDFGITVPTS